MNVYFAIKSLIASTVPWVPGGYSHITTESPVRNTNDQARKP